ncbi:MAG TPA: LysM peptidoglycan-binding domain-containing protein [Candidatus Didemnitutus sp.]|nr:LysM peptidoglycan-binding domain-containing protein [Candidatus Didemnitutus sp.]
MRNLLLPGCLSLLLATGTLPAQTRTGANDPMAELANLHQEVALLQQRVGELSLSLEQLTRDNAALQSKASESYVTLEQLNRTVAEINHTLQNGLAEQKRDILAQVGTQVEKLARQTQAAIDAVARNEAARPAIQTTFSENYPKEGISYTVQPGESLAVIAKKNNARMQDIINANKISDASKIRAGQTLFIPQGK